MEIAAIPAKQTLANWPKLALARLESGLSESSQGFESPILRQCDQRKHQDRTRQGLVLMFVVTYGCITPGGEGQLLDGDASRAARRSTPWRLISM